MSRDEWVKAAEDLFRKAEGEGVYFYAEGDRQGVPHLYAWVSGDDVTPGTLVQTECF